MIVPLTYFGLRITLLAAGGLMNYESACQRNWTESMYKVPLAVVHDATSTAPRPPARMSRFWWGRKLEYQEKNLESAWDRLELRPRTMNYVQWTTNRSPARFPYWHGLITHVSSHGGLQFLLSEIEPQLVKAPLAAAISSYLISLTHPTHTWNVGWNLR